VDAVLFITLLQPKGGRGAVKYLEDLKPPEGVAIKGVYFTLGRYDGVVMFESEDAKAAMDFCMQMGFATDYTVETLTAISAEGV
jgi:uncharacterized protein with GYD domain